MLTITDGGSLTRALELPLEPRLGALLLLREEQLGGEIAAHARFVIFQPGDRPCWLEETLGWSIFQNVGDGTWRGDPDFAPGWEWIEDHGFAYELAFQLTDDFTHVVIVENAPGVNRDVLEFCRTHALQSA